MAQPNGNGNGQLAKAKFWFSVFTFVGPAALALAITYGANKALEGKDAQRLINVENKLVEMEKRIEINRQVIESNRDRYATQQQVREYVDDLKEVLKQIRFEMQRR